MLKCKLLNYFIASIWLINGLLCKVLNLVPRHREIVSGILGDDNAGLFTIMIGLAEIVMAVWILSGVKSQLNAIIQIIIIVTMNILEFLLVPDLLLWGKANAIFAFIFTLMIYHNAFLNKSKVAQSV